MNLATHKPAKVGEKGSTTDPCVIERARFGHQSVAQDAYILTAEDLGSIEDAAEDDQADATDADLTDALYLLDRFLKVYPALNEWNEIPVDLALSLVDLHDETVEYLDQFILEEESK